MLGLLRGVMVQAAGLQEREGATPVRPALIARVPGLQRLWADGGYAGQLVAGGTTVLPRPRVLVQRPRRSQGLPVVQGRWIVERTCGWLHRARRLSQDYEAFPETTETWSSIALSQRMVRRLAARA